MALGAKNFRIMQRRSDGIRDGNEKCRYMLFNLARKNEHDLSGYIGGGGERAGNVVIRVSQTATGKNGRSVVYAHLTCVCFALGFDPSNREGKSTKLAGLRHRLLYSKSSNQYIYLNQRTKRVGRAGSRGIRRQDDYSGELLE